MGTAAPPDTPAPRGLDHVRTALAAERTFLAWTRTALAAIALGLAARQFLDNARVVGLQLDRVVAGMFIAVGIALTVVGHARYRGVMRDIETGSWREPRRLVDVIALTVLAVAVTGAAFALGASGW